MKKTILVFLIPLWLFWFSALSNQDNWSNKLLPQVVNPYNQSIDRSDFWMTMMTILSTIFAVFFVYTGFRIEDVKQKVVSAKNELWEIESEMQDALEFNNQLMYATSFFLSRQYRKSIDAFSSLRSESFVLRDDRKRATLDFYLANCYYEERSLKTKKEDLAAAVYFIEGAIEDPDHPLKKEIIAKFEELDTIEV